MMPTNAQQQCTRIFLSVWAVFACTLIQNLSLFFPAIAQGDAISQRRLTPTSILQHTSASASQKSKAKSIALERYQFYKRIEAKGIFGLDSLAGDHDDTVLFPIGRSDRIYLYTNVGGDDSSITCFQRMPGKDKQVYQVQLESKDRLTTKRKPVKTAKRLSSLLDYLTQEWPDTEGDAVQYYALSPGTSQYARKDLASKGDYVQYSYQSEVNYLEVRLLHDDSGANYDLDEDPMTKLNLRPGEFYKKYGLPVPPQELAILSSHKASPERSTVFWQEIIVPVRKSPYHQPTGDGNAGKNEDAPKRTRRRRKTSGSGWNAN